MNRKEKINRNALLVVLVLASIIFCFIRTVEDSLRFDEAMEYLISNTDYHRMNPLIQSTFQPPLYNYVIHIWLMISKSVIWFKLFNIVCYALCTLGLIKIMQYFHASDIMIVAAVICQNGCSGLVYYSQICGEYVLAFVLIYWMFYAALHVLRKPGWKTIISYMTLATLGIYTQYGMAFTIIGTGVMIMIALIYRKDYRNIIRLIASGIISVVCFVVPLYFFFVRIQTANQGSNVTSIGIKSMLKGLKKAVDFSLFCWHDNYQEILTRILIVSVTLIVVLTVIEAVRERKGSMHILDSEWLYAFGMIAVSLATYLPAVDSGIYAYGDYASRHTTLIMPLLVIGAMVFVLFTVRVLAENMVSTWIDGALVTITLGVFLFNAFHFNAIEHWDYDQIDNGLEVIADSSSPVWISVYAVPTALIYSNREEVQEEYINYYMQGITYEKNGITYSATDDIMKDYGNQLPKECVLLTFENDAGWTKADAAFMEQGYTKQILMEPISSRMGAGSVVVKYQLTNN